MVIMSSGLVSHDVPVVTAAITKPTSTETLAEHEVRNGSKDAIVRNCEKNAQSIHFNESL